MSPILPAPGGVVPSLAHTLLGAPYEPPLVPGQADYDLHAPAYVIGKDSARRAFRTVAAGCSL